MVQHFRVGRHTTDIQAMKTFYIDTLGLENLGEFKDHDGYSAVFIGSKDHTWHLEFTQSDDSPDHKPDEDDVLVFYTVDDKSYNELISKLDGANSEVVKAKNPYWDSNGRTYLDPDGFRVVICHRDWRYDT